MKREGIISIVVIVLAFAMTAFGFNQTTGNVTETPGAYYSDSNPRFGAYSDCTYLGLNDGWDVNVKSKVRAYDRTRQEWQESEDNCDSESIVVEYHCEDGYLKERIVRCPAYTNCVDGVCARR